MNHCKCNNNHGTVSITMERYEQLIRAEQDANCLKTLIADKYANYQPLSREEMKLIVTMFIGIKED